MLLNQSNYHQTNNEGRDQAEYLQDDHCVVSAAGCVVGNVTTLAGLTHLGQARFPSPLEGLQTNLLPMSLYRKQDNGHRMKGYLSGCPDPQAGVPRDMPLLPTGQGTHTPRGQQLADMSQLLHRATIQRQMTERSI